MPKTIDCVLYGSLVKECSTGDAVTLSGIVKVSWWYMQCFLILSLVLLLKDFCCPST